MPVVYTGINIIIKLYSKFLNKEKLSYYYYYWKNEMKNRDYYTDLGGEHREADRAQGIWDQFSLCKTEA